MDLDTQKKIVNILKILQNKKNFAGSKDIARQLTTFGDFLPERTVRYYLKVCDKLGYTKKVSQRAGRIITEKGKDEISNAFVLEKVGIVASKIDTLGYSMRFSLKKKGDIILNISIMDKNDFHRNKDLVRSVFEAGIAMGDFILLSENLEDFAGLEKKYSDKKDRLLVGTVCSITLNGILLSQRIIVNSRFGGLLEMRNGIPYRFVELINYNGTTLDPIEIFLRGRMTSVRDYLMTGNGKIAASFREVPVAAYYEVLKIRKFLEKMSLNGILAIGKPGMPLCDIPVTTGMFGIIVCGGLNPIAPLVESGVDVDNYALRTLYDFNKLEVYKTVL
jgi:HTH-type transcriptional regulator, global nitrogen regulator NrpRI